MKKIIIILLLIVLPSALAHQPRLVQDSTFDNPIIVEDPEVSKAYYGILEGNSEYYLIETEKEIPIYINILVPDLENTSLMSAELLDENLTQIYLLDGENFEWEEFYEPYGMDNYLKGPELGKHFKSTQNLSEGIYYIRVFNSENIGPYSLAVGYIESFPIKEILNVLFILPIIKILIFEKNYLLLLPLILIISYIYYRKKYNKKGVKK